MSTPAPSDPTSSPATSEAAPAQSFEYNLHEFWRKNSRAILVLCAVVFIFIVGREALQWYGRYREEKIGAAYAAAGSGEKLKAFAEAHAGHALAGAAHLRLGDEAYAAGNFSDAIAAYERAAAVFEDGPLAGRASIGIAIAKIGLGQTAEGQEKLTQLAGDVRQLKTIRAEAYYHLASLALTAGKTDEATKALDQLTAVEPVGTWAQRGLALRATLPTADTAPEAQPEPSVKIQLPGQP